MPNITLSFEDTLAVLTFDREGSSANIFDTQTIGELSSMIDRLQDATHTTGLIICSAKPTIFVAGADLKELTSLRGEALSQMIKAGQNVFNRIADLPFTSVAAIHGACVGGGFELALACDWRVASDSSKTRIGLPETQLGILPAWGGSTRLPDLIGLQDALKVILSGKLSKASAAKHKGLVDETVPVEHLMSEAKKYVTKGKRHLTHNPLTHNHGVAAIARRMAHAELIEKTRGHYPGPEAALEVVANSIGESRDVSLKSEHDAILRLSELPETKQLIHLFFLQERARKHQHSTAEAKSVRRLGVVGSGVMGSGIAYWLSSRGLQVTLQDISHEALAHGMESIRHQYAEATKRHIFTKIESARALDRIHPSGGGANLRNCDLIIEAAVEELSIKQKIFADLSSHSRPDTLLATNTSALPIHHLIPHVSHPERLLGLHFFNPVHRMQLVEVVRTETSSDETVATAVAFVRKIGKLPVVVKDSPGFLVNRILMPYLVEAASLFERGGDPDDIDSTMLDYGMPMGPLRLLDEVGLDVALHVAETLSAAYPDRMRVPGIIRKLVEAGFVGRKAGSGFYNYDDDDDTTNAAALDLCEETIPIPLDTQQRLADLLTDEAQRCLDEGIAESADDINLAMVLGTGYPAFRGGPLQNE
ncbi:3-hydroxyacyl-CoA dehydrogenase NAD-binding domain-containing protein [Haloferula chungangensis]|uniref:enoyl-CoA hydratase n=1 Tax=Haloferula chungangensis TaxID=1048331 RepID=A0ABW2L1L1_9BACT